MRPAFLNLFLLGSQFLGDISFLLYISLAFSIQFSKS